MSEWRLEPPANGPEFEIELRIKEGDRVRPGDVIAIVTSDKATQEMEAFEGGTITGVIKTRRGYVLLVDETAQG
jgi:pyruvate/2-oxoglutarate dehydrogenase complex dihydrolipoamide acyltransferase (E2) component